MRIQILIQLFQGGKADNMDYSNLVMARSKLYLAEKNTKDADYEFNHMMSDLVTRGVKYDTLSRLTKRYNKMKNPRKTDWEIPCLQVVRSQLVFFCSKSRGQVYIG